MTSSDAASPAKGPGCTAAQRPDSAPARQPEGMLTLYTAQAQVVVDTIERDGVYHVKTAYVDQKYGDQAWIFKQAYSFFARYAGQYVPKPEGAESGIWVYYDEKWVGAQRGSWVLKLEVPASQVVSFDLRVWNKMLNLQYVPADEADGQRFEHKLETMGVGQSMQAFSTPFYPLIKREIEASWQRLFTSAAGCTPEYLQAGLWEIRHEWVVDARQV